MKKSMAAGLAACCLVLASGRPGFAADPIGILDLSLSGHAARTSGDWHTVGGVGLRAQSIAVEPSHDRTASRLTAEILTLEPRAYATELRLGLGPTLGRSGAYAMAMGSIDWDSTEKRHDAGSSARVMLGGVEIGKAFQSGPNVVIAGVYAGATMESATAGKHEDFMFSANNAYTRRGLAMGASVDAKLFRRSMEPGAVWVSLNAARLPHGSRSNASVDVNVSRFVRLGVAMRQVTINTGIKETGAPAKVNILTPMVRLSLAAGD